MILTWSSPPPAGRATASGVQKSDDAGFVGDDAPTAGIGIRLAERDDLVTIVVDGDHR
jgi:hypothetical protein